MSKVTPLHEAEERRERAFRAADQQQPEQVLQVRDAETGEPVVVDMSEDSLATAFAQHHAGQLLFDHTRGTWLIWDGSRWKREETRLAFDWVRSFVRRMNIRTQQKWTKAAAFSNVELIARTDRLFARTSADFDQDPWLLATPGGAVDLRTGLMKAADPADMITKCTAVYPAPSGAHAPRWQTFLAQATRGDRELVDFLQKLLGYSLAGVTTEQMLAFIYGPGGNGKGVLINTAMHLLGDYAQAADMAVFTASRHERHPTELAALKGARLVAASETERDRAWAEARIKQLTGGDRIRARFMRQDEFEFDPQFQLVIVGNHKPRLSVVDDAMRRRLAIVNFMHRPPTKNPNLEAELREEGPEILRWMIDGCLRWQREGLTQPPVVVAATNEYFVEQDLFRSWVDDCCEIGAQHSETAGQLFKSWSDYAKRAGEDAGSQKAFAEELSRAGFEPRKLPGGKRIRLGIRLQTGPAESDPRTPGDWN